MKGVNVFMGGIKEPKLFSIYELISNGSQFLKLFNFAVFDLIFLLLICLFGKYIKKKMFLR